jgi:hypothetical protein
LEKNAWSWKNHTLIARQLFICFSAFYYSLFAYRFLLPLLIAAVSLPLFIYFSIFYFKPSIFSSIHGTKK